ncbi:MAG: hypothetical protein HZB51_00810 [Chloroflexi bacterium]|nr:hypothetical protein [Chloroflexota bacterium]
MDTQIIVALIGVVGSALVAVLNQLLAHRVKASETKIAKLYALSMSENAFGQLKKLSTGNFGGFWLDPNLTVGLAAEINYFKILGYIEFKNIADTRDLPKGDHPNENLSDYIRVTPQGHAFIALRSEAKALENA